MFWDDSDERAKIKNPFTHPSVPNHIRRQMIKDTFADRIRAYGGEKNKAVSELRKISNDLVDDFERHMRLLGNQKYQRLREEYDMDAELTEDFDFPDKMLNETADQVFRLKSALPSKGRIVYQLLPEGLKKQVDCLTGYLLSQIPELKRLWTDYVESKMKMVYLYGGSEEYLRSQRKQFEAEADKIIANRILGMVKTLNRLDDEGRTEEYRERRKKYYMDQMILGMLDMLLSIVDTNCRLYDDFERAWRVELSKEARKELYLKYQDQGYEH